MFIKVKVFPKSKESGIIRKSEDSFEIKVKEKAEQGAANQAVIGKLAEFFNVEAGRIRLVKGKKQRNKIFDIKNESN